MIQQTQPIYYVLCVGHNLYDGDYRAEDYGSRYSKIQHSSDLNEMYSVFLDSLFNDHYIGAKVYLYQTTTPFGLEDIEYIVERNNSTHCLAKFRHDLARFRSWYRCNSENFNLISVNSRIWKNLSKENQNLTLNINHTFIKLCGMKKKQLYKLITSTTHCFTWLSRLCIDKDTLIYTILFREYLKQKN
jgi:hypothetical protein